MVEQAAGKHFVEKRLLPRLQGDEAAEDVEEVDEIRCVQRPAGRGAE
jgi:hypothetical protein